MTPQRQISRTVRNCGLKALWIGTVAAAAVVTVAAIRSGAAAYLETVRPVNEGEFLARVTEEAVDLYRNLEAAGTDGTVAVRQIRNRTEAAAVGIVDRTGRYLAATSPTLDRLEEGFVLSELRSGRFVAAARQLPDPLLVDGVADTPPGGVVYEAARPLGDGRALVMLFDLPDLRRHTLPPARTSRRALQLLALGLVSGAVTVAAVVTRLRSARCQRAAMQEADDLREHSARLETLNRQLRQAQAETMRALTAAEEANRVRTDFTLMITHELRTPLTSVVTGVELLANGDLPNTERDEILSYVLGDARRLDRLIGQMLTVAKVEAHGFDTANTDLDAPALVRRLVDSHSRLTAAGDPPAVSVTTDPDMACTLVGSLTDNAYIHGATRVWIETSTRLGDQPMFVVGDINGPRLFVTVADDGPGIDPDFLPRAFDKFSKSGTSPGTGLGLYLVRLMAESLGAGIAVTTGPDGTRISVALPLTYADVEAAS